MRQPFTVAIAMRYLRARASAFISFISAVSMLGIALAVAVLIIVMAVINGFESELERRLLSVSPDARLLGYADGRAAPVDEWPLLAEAALERADVNAVAPFVEGQAMLSAGERLHGVTLRGIDPARERSVTSIHERLVRGDYEALAGDGAIVIGRSLADTLGVSVGDDVIVMLPRARITGAGLMPRIKTFVVAGLFDVGMQEFDDGLVFVGFDIAAKLYGTGGQASGISLDVSDRYAAETIIDEFGYEMARRFREDYLPDVWRYRHANVFRSIELTKPMLFIILSLVVLIAAFNIVSTLFMVVREKRGDIAILRTIGSTPRNILTIFVVQGSSIGLVGTLAGLVLGLVLVGSLATVVGWVESASGLDLLAGDVYVIGDLPTEARAAEIAQICLLAFGLAVLAALYPAWRASRQPPAEALRHE